MSSPIHTSKQDKFEELLNNYEENDQQELEDQRQEDAKLFYREQKRRQQELNQNQNTQKMENGEPLLDSQKKSNFYSSCCSHHFYSDDALEELKRDSKNITKSTNHATTIEAETDAGTTPTMTPEELNIKKINAVLATKEDGNILFREGKYAEAIQIYERGTLILMMIMTNDDVLKVQVRELETQLNLNIAFAELKRSKPYVALSLVQRILDLDKTVLKAYYRKAQALIAMQDFNEALDAITDGKKMITEQLKELELKLEFHSKAKEKDTDVDADVDTDADANVNLDKTAITITKDDAGNTDSIEIQSKPDTQVIIETINDDITTLRKTDTKFTQLQASCRRKLEQYTLQAEKNFASLSKQMQKGYRK